MAQDFPNKTISLMVPFPPGGPNDIIARVVANDVGDPQADDRHRQPFGSGRCRRHRRRRQLAPDGYTIGIASAGALAISPSMEKVPYETLKDLAPVTLVAKVPEMLVVATSVPANNMKELLRWPNRSPANSTSPHRSRQHATSRRRTFQAHRQDQRRARALSRRGAGRTTCSASRCRWCSSISGAVAADQGRQAHADRGRRAMQRVERARVPTTAEAGMPNC